VRRRSLAGSTSSPVTLQRPNCRPRLQRGEVTECRVRWPLRGRGRSSPRVRARAPPLSVGRGALNFSDCPRSPCGGRDRPADFTFVGVGRVTNPSMRFRPSSMGTMAAGVRRNFEGPNHGGLSGASNSKTGSATSTVRQAFGVGSGASFEFGVPHRAIRGVFSFFCPASPDSAALETTFRQSPPAIGACPTAWPSRIDLDGRVGSGRLNAAGRSEDWESGHRTRVPTCLG